MAHLKITTQNDEIDLDMSMTPEEFVESFITLMIESNDFKRLVLASAQAYKITEARIENEETNI